jgi:hypothetical protein
MEKSNLLSDNCRELDGVRQMDGGLAQPRPDDRSTWVAKRSIRVLGSRSLGLLGFGKARSALGGAAMAEFGPSLFGGSLQDVWGRNSTYAMLSGFAAGQAADWFANYAVTASTTTTGPGSRIAGRAAGLGARLATEYIAARVVENYLERVSPGFLLRMEEMRLLSAKRILNRMESVVGRSAKIDSAEDGKFNR